MHARRALGTDLQVPPHLPTSTASTCCTQGFEECANVPAAFKLFDSFEGLLDRDAIGSELERKHAELVRSFLLELREVSRPACTAAAVTGCWRMLKQSSFALCPTSA